MLELIILLANYGTHNDLYCIAKSKDANVEGYKYYILISKIVQDVLEKNYVFIS
jgi:hypothetical protein